jgi:hypothetical protein
MEPVRGVGAIGKRRSGAIGACAAIAACAALLGAPAPAAAIPWDKGGAVPPSETPEPVLPDPNCTQSYANDAPGGGRVLRFGIGPRLAGEAGEGQTVPTVPEDPGLRDAALEELQGDGFFAVRLNRLFMSEGQAGIDEFKRMARHYAKLGLDVELQVRYHPADEDNGDIAKWLRFVRKVVREFGPNEHVTGLQIANEVNLGLSKNTSDGYYDRAVEALVKGVVTASRLSEKLGYDHQEIGFNYAWRADLFDPANDSRFWEQLGALGGRRLRRHTDWVGIDLYPGTFTPGVLAPATIIDIGDAWLEAIAQVRECFMPLAGIGPRKPLRIEETGYATGPGRSEADQLDAVKSFVTAADDYRGTYNIRDFRWFGLRDNNSEGPSFQQYFGLLADDYEPKPAFAAYRRLIARHGAKLADVGCLGRASRRQEGTAAAERLSGGREADGIAGLGGDDVIRGFAGPDCLVGGGGSDEIHGGRGADRIDSRDGRRDWVACGAGSRDRVRGDRKDVIAANCERVRAR